MPVWYPSKKMQCIIKAESHKVEFAFLPQAEHSDDVLEIWDQPPAIQLEYKEKRNRVQRPTHTADYFVFGAKGRAIIETIIDQLKNISQIEHSRHRHLLSFLPLYVKQSGRNESKKR